MRARGAREGEEMGMPLLRVRGLQVVYGAVTAVQDLSLTVEAGQAMAILGANGAGKSSTLRTIAGLQRPRAGEIWFAGARIDRWSTERLVRHGLSLVPDTRDLFPRFTVAENLRMGAHCRSSRDFAARRAAVLALFPALERRLGSPAWTLSGGEQQMLALGRALLAQPRLLLFEQTTVAALGLVQYAYVLRNGRVALEGPREALQHDPRVLDLYLGGAEGEGHLSAESTP